MSDSESKSQTKSEGGSSKEAFEDKTSSTNIYQEWKGGMSGATELQWRTSLSAHTNSNWRIIDHYIDSCRGIWRWVENDPKLKEQICGVWMTTFLDNMGIPLEEAKVATTSSCQGNGNMQEFKKAVESLKQEKDLTKLVEDKAACLKKSGFHFEGGACKENACTCGAGVVGLTGAECSVHGSVACKESQKAKCKGFVCPAGYQTKKDKKAKCATNICTVADDLETCCEDVKLASKFLVSVKTKDQSLAGTDDDVYVKIEGEDDDSGWRQLDSSDNDFNPGSERDYTVELKAGKKAFVPVKICFKLGAPGWTPGWFGADAWKMGSNPPVTLYKADLPKNKGKIGEAYNFKEFEDEKPQCRTISYAFGS